jgi:hypothetical protein
LACSLICFHSFLLLAFSNDRFSQLLNHALHHFYLTNNTIKGYVEEQYVAGFISCVFNDILMTVVLDLIHSWCHSMYVFFCVKHAFSSREIFQHRELQGDMFLVKQG